MSEPNQAAEETLQAYAAMWSNRDYDAIPELVGESFTGSFPEGDVHGVGEFEGFMRQFLAAFPDFQVEITDVIPGEDSVVAEGAYTMTHKGDFEGIPATDERVELPAMAKLRVEDGKVTEHREFHDRQAILEQLGVAEP